MLTIAESLFPTDLTEGREWAKNMNSYFEHEIWTFAFQL